MMNFVLGIIVTLAAMYWWPELLLFVTRVCG